MKICIFTSSRAEYGLLKKLIQLISKDSFFKQNLVVTGSHLSKKYGTTSSEIIDDGIRIDKKIFLNLDQSNSFFVNKNFAQINSEMAKYFKRRKFDLFLVLGDRYEVLAAVISAYINRVPVAHIHGGEKTIDSLDDAYRHSISKFSNLHFVAHQNFKKRLLQLGETKNSIFNVGGLGAASIDNLNFLEKDEIEKKLNVKFKKHIILINFYPEISNLKNSINKLNQILKKIKKIKNSSLIFTLPSHDIGNNDFEKKIINFVKKNKNCNVYKNLGQKNFLSLMKVSSLMIGNSSSGILEYPSFNKFSINIGNRQQGRVFSKSVINLPSDITTLDKIIIKLLKIKRTNKVINSKNLYFKKNTIKNIVRVLKKNISQLNNIKNFNDLKI